MQQSSILSAKFDCPVPHQNVSLLDTAHDWNWLKIHNDYGLACIHTNHKLCLEMPFLCSPLMAALFSHSYKTIFSVRFCQYGWCLQKRNKTLKLYSIWHKNAWAMYVQYIDMPYNSCWSWAGAEIFTGALSLEFIVQGFYFTTNLRKPFSWLVELIYVAKLYMV